MMKKQSCPGTSILFQNRITRDQRRSKGKDEAAYLFDVCESAGDPLQHFIIANLKSLHDTAAESTRFFQVFHEFLNAQDYTFSQPIYCSLQTLD